MNLVDLPQARDMPGFPEPFFSPLVPHAVACWGPIQKLNAAIWSDIAEEHIPYDFQPIFDLRTREVRAYEALYRGGFAAPVSWVAVDTQFLRLLGRHSAGVRLFINLSVQTILTIDERIVVAASRCNDVIFEWTEGHCSDAEFSAVAARLNRWIVRGCKVAIDDFGKGEDGLSRLLALARVESVKLDGDLITQMINHPFGQVVISHQVAMCHKIGAKVVAECIETAEMMLFSQVQGIDMAQGYYLDGQRGRPTGGFAAAANGRSM